MKIEVKKNTKRNIFFGGINKFVMILLPFALRTIIIKYLGAEYLGLNSLFTSILQVLSLSELGFSSAVVYNMYKPIAENDQQKINALLNIYKRVYKYIGLVILGIGICVIPFLPHLISGSIPKGVHLITLYLIQLFNSSISYFLFGYKQSLLAAYQREDINSIINLIVQTGLQITQIILIFKTQNYYLYTACLPLFTVINNIWIMVATRKRFPYAKCEGRLEREEITGIKKIVIGTFIQRACHITRNSLDSICLSTFLGLTITAIYSNYYTIFYGITSFLAIIGTSLSAGIGNHVTLKSVNENFDELQKLDFLYMLISGWCTACLVCLYQSFMYIWMGEELMMSKESVVFLCIYFYVLKIGDMRYMYTSAKGLWWEMRYRAILETICNVFLNITLGRIFGINGIIVATIISLLLFNNIWGAKIIFDQYFKKDKLVRYFIYHLSYAVVTTIICVVTNYTVNFIKINNNIIEFILKMVVCMIFSMGLYIIIYFKTSIFKKSIEFVKCGKSK